MFREVTTVLNKRKLKMVIRSVPDSDLALNQTNWTGFDNLHCEKSSQTCFDIERVSNTCAANRSMLQCWWGQSRHAQAPDEECWGWRNRSHWHVRGACWTSGQHLCQAQNVKRVDGADFLWEHGGAQHFKFKRITKMRWGTGCSELAQIAAEPGKVPISIALYIDNIYIKHCIPILPLYSELLVYIWYHLFTKCNDDIMYS